ncbi:hypothetical protein KKD19_00100 [Patescibacteria group bacterium]|nr:hypothetical protein [Patescibacteria group bacterium]MBU4511639.1 hypothetical protein [Patescibacteria group bacterium]MCG2692709.1 hypothetical protein [Candidatus Parcubacteria bacterium]
MSKRTKIILTIIITILLVLLVFIIYLNYENILELFENQPVVLTNQEKEMPEESPGLPEEGAPIMPPPIAVSPEEVKRGQLAQFSSSFAEKFGSYSSQNNYQNFKELKVFMTPQMWSWVENNLIISGEGDKDIYYGQTTKALSTQENSYDAVGGNAEFLVKCQRQEAGDNFVNPRVYYQDITIELERYGDNWLVAAAYWQ